LFVLGRDSFSDAETAKAPYIISALIGGPWFKFLFAVVGVVVGGIPAALTPQAAVAQLLYGMARDGKPPRVLAHVSESKNVPDVAILVVSAVTLVLMLSFYTNIETLTSMVNFGALTGFLMLHISVIAHFMLREKSKAWGRHLLMPLVGFVIVAY